ncbi:7-carboxy-7-deazaguanine synthase [Gordonia bronchialis]|uniref:7-carboxy-7-deazaguanine synthase n=1 Tax=Gordonia bronchialis TaxID=2054 RepID=UPI00226D9C9B|nr:7-carboxy-7-deazaguanine synthase [Gordonia bronchialis]
MTYKVKEVFYTLQGEGSHAGRPAVFCRFASCNLWTGRERDRHRAVCQFCDTDFVGTDGPGGGKFATASELADAVAATWKSAVGDRMVVCTGGEPLLQLDEALVQEFHKRAFYVAVETNGTVSPPRGIDWLCVSPKKNAPLVVSGGDELKLVYPQDDLSPARFELMNFKTLRLQPMDGPNIQKNTEDAVAYCLENPKWRLSLQTHKLLGIP